MSYSVLPSLSLLVQFCITCRKSISFPLQSLIFFFTFHFLHLDLCIFFLFFVEMSLFLSPSLSPCIVSLLSLMRPAPPWWWDWQRVIKVESHLVGKLTSIRAILPRGPSPPLCFCSFHPSCSLHPWLSSTIFYSPWPAPSLCQCSLSIIFPVLLSTFISHLPPSTRSDHSQFVIIGYIVLWW